MTGRLFLFLGAAGVFIITAGVYVAATDGGFSSVGNLIADFGAILGISNKNEGELVAVIPLDTSDKESVVVAAKIQNNKPSQSKPEKTKSNEIAVITPPPTTLAAQDTDITEQQPPAQQLPAETQPQQTMAPVPVPQELVMQEPAIQESVSQGSTIQEPAQEPIRVLIGEIQAGTNQNGVEDEFIELYNPTNRIIDMKGWSLIKKTSSGSSYNLVSSAKFFGSIAPKSFFLVAHASYKGVKPADLIYSANSNNVAYKDNAVALYDETDAVIDEILWSEISKDKSLERKALINSICISAQNENELKGNGCDTDNVNDFELREAPNPQNSFNERE